LNKLFTPSVESFFMSKTVRDIAKGIVLREGGFVNDPDDLGGATNFGVTIHTMRRLGLDLDGDGDVNIEDVKALQRDQAVDLFIEHYFVAPGLVALPELLQASVFDMYVNAGSSAVKILQRLLRDMGYVLTVDGIVGPQTLAGLMMLLCAHPKVLLMPTELRAVTITSASLTVGLRVVNLRARERVARAGGYDEPRSLFGQSFT
jgi:lysozyme family protein